MFGKWPPLSAAPVRSDVPPIKARAARAPYRSFSALENLTHLWYDILKTRGN